MPFCWLIIPQQNGMQYVKQKMCNFLITYVKTTALFLRQITKLMNSTFFSEVNFLADVHGFPMFSESRKFIPIFAKI